MCITETHLMGSVKNSFIDIEHYNVIRHDTLGGTPKHGVCMYMHESLKFDCVESPCPNCLSVRLSDFNIYVITVYRPPSYSSIENQTLLKYLVGNCLDKEVLLLGDFNLPSLQWDSADVLSEATALDRLFCEAFLTLGLTQWVTESTFPRSGNILDLILVSEHDRVGSVTVLSPLIGCDHCVTTCEYLFENVENSPAPAVKDARQWHKGKYNAISRKLEEIDWDFEFAFLNVEGAYSRLMEITSPLIAELIPLSKPNSKISRPPWKVNPPSSLRNRRKDAWDRYKTLRSRLGRHSHETREAMTSFFAANRSLRNFAVASQSQYEEKLLEELKSNPKQLHAYLRKKKVGCPSVGPLRLDGKLTDDPATMAESFASAFESVYVPTNPNLVPEPHQTVNSRMEPVVLHLQDVKDVLCALDINSAAGGDGLHPMLLYSCASQLSYPIFKIYKLSLTECNLPSSWKSSVVVPIYKKGSRYNPLNYRPISLTSVACKCLERIIAKQLYEYLESNHILSDHQFGFRAGRSTMDQLLLTYDDISLWLDGGRVVDLILFDFSKAFDVVSHSILLAKLVLLGVDRQLSILIESFLITRTMSVSIKGQHSSPRRVTSGVPQGSVLGPSLFLILVNHIRSKLSCRYKIFADDLKMYMKICHDDESDYRRDSQMCQSDIDTLQRIVHCSCIKRQSLMHSRLLQSH